MRQANSSRRAVRMLVEGAVLVAIAEVLSFFKLWEMPWGGSVDLAMLPLFLYACRWGVGPGLMAGFVMGVLQFLSAGGFAIGWQSILGDYLVAYTALGLAGFFRYQKTSVFLGTLAGGLARFLVHYVVGATVWKEYMPESFFGMTMTTPWFYSLLYNGVYMGIDILLCLVIFALLMRPMEKYLLAEDIR